MYQYTHLTLITPTLRSSFMFNETLPFTYFWDIKWKKVEIMKLKNVISEIISFVFFSVIRCFRYSYLVVCTKHIRCFYKFTTVAKINYCATSKNSCLLNSCSIDGLEDRYMYWDQKEAICFASVSTSRVHPLLLTENHR